MDAILFEVHFINLPVYAYKQMSRDIYARAQSDSKRRRTGTQFHRKQLGISDKCHAAS